MNWRTWTVKVTDTHGLSSPATIKVRALSQAMAESRALMEYISLNKHPRRPEDGDLDQIEQFYARYKTEVTP